MDDILREDGLIRPKHVGMLINLFLISECFKVYFSAKSWFFFKYESGLLHGHKMKMKSHKSLTIVHVALTNSGHVTNKTRPENIRAEPNRTTWSAT